MLIDESMDFLANAFALHITKTMAALIELIM